MKKISCIALTFLMLISMFAFPVSAAKSKSIGLAPNCSWSTRVKCTLNKNILGKAKSGKVRVTINNYGVNVDVCMKNGSKVIWSQNNAISGKNKTAWTCRDFSLGNDHKYYDLYFRCSKKCACAPGVTVKNLSNCDIT